MAGRKTGDELAHKQRHDAEQRDYLAERNIRTAFHLEEGARLKSPAINPANAAVHRGAMDKTTGPRSW